MVAQVIENPLSTGIIPTPYNPDPALLAIVEIIRDGLIRDQHVRLHNFGTFRLRWSSEHQIKNPRTGSKITVADTPKITFTPAKHLRFIIEPKRKRPVPIGNTNQNNLVEAVQDIVDDNYGSTKTDFYTVTAKNNKHDSSMKWALGLLAAIPLILTLLQLNISADKNSPEALHPAQNQVTDISDIKKVTSPTSSIADSINQSNSQPNGDDLSISVTAARIVPDSPAKSFYLKPQIHTIQEGENLWSLAKQFYGDALLWPHIYRANMRTLSDPDRIIVGKQLVIPGLQQSPDNLTNRDKALIAEGYYEVYQLNRANQSAQAIYFLISAGQFSMEWLSDRKPSIPGNDWEFLIRQN